MQKQLNKKVFLGSIRLPFVIVALLAIAVFTVILLVNRGTPPPAQTRITVLLQALEITQWQPLVDEFEAQNPDIKLDMIEGPNATNLVEDLYTSSFLLGDSPYDLVYMDIVWVPKFAAAGWLMPLNDRATQVNLEGFLDEDLAGGSYQGQLYRMPLRSDGGMLYYRKDLLNQIGATPPETFEDIVDISKELQSRGLVDWGYVWQGRQYEGLSAMFVEILAGYGVFWVNPETLEVGLDQPEAIAAVEFLKSTITEGIAPPGVTTYQEEETRRLFQSGKVAFMRNWPYAWSLGNAEDSPIAGQFGIKPMVHGEGFDSAACLGGWGLGIAASSQHPDVAWRLIEFFVSQEAQRQFILKNSYVPSQRSLFTDPAIVQEFPHYPELQNVIESAVLRPPIAQYAQASDILQRYLSAALTGRNSAAEAMQLAADETRRLLGGLGA
jgi:multiple sugar transport system substrate-binding protein